MTKEKANFTDPLGREWTALIQWGHPVPAELGIVAVRFECLSDAAQPPRVGFVLSHAIEAGDTPTLVQALRESEPATPIGEG